MVGASQEHVGNGVVVVDEPALAGSPWILGEPGPDGARRGFSGPVRQDCERRERTGELVGGLLVGDQPARCESGSAGSTGVLSDVVDKSPHRLPLGFAFAEAGLSPCATQPGAGEDLGRYPVRIGVEQQLGLAYHTRLE